MNTEMTPETVAQDMFTVLHGQPAPVVTRWTYSAADPFAVTLGVRGRRDRFVEWLVARDLVIESLSGPAGCGDIRMSPQHVQGYDIIEIEIRSTDGRAVLEVDRDTAAAVRRRRPRPRPGRRGGGPHGPRRGDPEDHAQLRGLARRRSAHRSRSPPRYRRA